MSDRPSRQDLVVPPQGSNLSFALTAAACACAGFGVVWGVLAFRGSPARDAALEAPTVAAEDAGPPPSSEPTEALAADVPAHVVRTGGYEPDRFAVPVTRTDAADEPSAPLADSDAPFAAPTDDRYARRAGGFRAPGGGEPVDPATATPEPRNAAFPPDTADDLGITAVAAEIPADGDPSEGGDPATAPSGVDTPDGLPPAPDALASTEDPLEPGADPGEDAPLPEDRGDLAADTAPPADAAAPPANPFGSPPQSPPPSAPALNPFTAPAAVPVATAPPVNPFAVAPMPVPVAGPDPTATSADRSLSTRSASWSPDSDVAPGDDPEAPIPVGAVPPRGAPPVAAGMPFASAPPIAGAAPAAVPEAAPSEAVRPAPSSGQGRPGAIQLEGVQTPQLAVEKRGPREVQVGKTARFEVLVRNVGSAVANDVVLRDSVPFGTSLVATTPPAAPAGPGGDPGELVWMLGTLPPGGQARVAVDLMPMTEGEVGSVANVSFRAEASVRTRATRPALQIVAETPTPVLVGVDSNVTITISNPGTGAATGVVLEGLLPEGLTHRAGRELEFDVGSLAPGDSRSIDLVLATTGPGVHGLRLLARADGQIEVAETVKVAVTAPTLDLAVKMPVRRFLQRPATCAISMTNAGTAPAVGVELVAQLPPGLKFVRANNAGYYEERTHRVLWNLEELPAAETGEVEMVLMPIALGPQKIVAAARTSAGLSDQVAHAVEVEGLAALSFEVADSEDPIEIGGVSEYVIRVVNQGTKPASGVRVLATLLGDMEPVEARGPAPHRVDNLSIAFEPLAKLAPSEEALYRVRVRGRREGDQRVQVQLTSDEQPAPITKEETTRVYADR